MGETTVARQDARRIVEQAHPHRWLGAAAVGGLALPAAAPTASQMYAPRGVFFNDDHLVVADSGNHRILIWQGYPAADHQAADVVLGQPDFESEGPNAAGAGPEAGLHLPTGVWIHKGKLLVADAWNHRILVWDSIPDTNHQPPNYVLGQMNLTEREPNRGGAVSGSTLYWPYGLAVLDDWFYVTDTGNRRVLGWDGLPTSDRPCDLVLGQACDTENRENREGAVNACSFRWPHAVAGDSQRLYVADAGNHRVLGWVPKVEADADANVLLGQPDMQSNSEFPYTAQGPQRMRFPYAICGEGDLLAVADTANNRILVWQGWPDDVSNRPADAVIGQHDFDGNGENRWDSVQPDTLCWPYGIHLHRGRLAVADSGNNRVMIWNLTRNEADVFGGAR